MKSLLHLFKNPWNSQQALMEISMMPFLNFLAPILGSALGGIGSVGSALGTGLSGLGSMAGGLLGKLPVLGKGGLGLGQAVTDITGGVGGLFNRGGGLLSQIGGGNKLIGAGGIGKQGFLSKLFGNQEAPATNNPSAVDPFADTTRVDEQGNLYNSQPSDPMAGARAYQPPAAIAAETFKVNPPATESGFQQPLPATADPSILDQAVKVSEVMSTLNGPEQPIPTSRAGMGPAQPIQGPKLMVISE